MNVDKALIRLESKRDKLVDTLPTILFFTALLWIVTLAFGSEYLLVSPPTPRSSRRGCTSTTRPRSTRASSS